MNVGSSVLFLATFMQQIAHDPLPEPQLRCGAYCLYVALEALDIDVGDYGELERRLGQPLPRGYSMEQLAAVAGSYGAHALGVRTSIDSLLRRRGRFACIALIRESGHFVCVYDADSRNVHLVDPPQRRSVPRDAFESIWSGESLLIAQAPLTVDTLSRGTGVAFLGISIALCCGVFILYR